MNRQMLLRLRRPTCQTTPVRTIAARACAGAALAALAAAPPELLAADRVTPPLPVPRPRFETPARPPAAPSAPAPAPTAPAPLPAPAPAPAPADTAPPADVNDPYVRLGELPREEQRVILRRCASEWDRKKSEGTLAGLLWRDFLGQCLPDR